MRLEYLKFAVICLNATTYFWTPAIVATLKAISMTTVIQDHKSTCVKNENS